MVLLAEWFRLLPLTGVMPTGHTDSGQVPHTTPMSKNILTIYEMNLDTVFTIDLCKRKPMEAVSFDNDRYQ